MPKSQEFNFVVPGSPEEVSKRLKAESRWRLIPFQGGIITPTDRPLAGRVSDSGFALAVNKRDWLTLMQAVAKGELQETPGGTRVQGVAGMPAWVTWLLRFASVAALGLLVFGAYMTLNSAGDAAGLIALLFGAVMVSTVLGIGLNVRNADEQVPELVSRLEAAARGAAPLLQGEGASVREDAEARQRRAQAASRQRQG